LANARCVIALSSASAFVRVEVRQLQFSDVLVVDGKNGSGNLGSAAIVAQVILDTQKVLRPLNSVTNKGDVQGEVGSASLGSMHFHIVDDAIWQLQQRSLNFEDKLMQIGGCSLENNGPGSESFVQSALKGQGK